MTEAPVPDPLTDPRVVAARARVTSTERTRERFADVTAETQTGTSTAVMKIYGRFDPDGAPWGISAQDVADALDALPDGTERLNVHIHSRGGDAFEGLAILNLLRQAKPEVHVVVDGLAASAASAAAMAGKTVTMAPSSQMMIHDASGIGFGQANDMRILATALDSISESYAAAYAARAGGDVAEWRTAMVPETWYRADEAVAAGLADAVQAPKAEQAATASFDLSIFAHAGRDAAPAPFMPERAPQAPAAPADGSTTHERSAAVAFTDEQLTTMRQQLGLPDDADEAAILAAQTEALAERADPPAADPPTGDPAAAPPAAAPPIAASASGVTTTIDTAVLASIQEQAKKGEQAFAAMQAAERDRLIEAAVGDGKLPRSRVAHWTTYWKADPEGAKAALAAMPKNLVPVATAGYAGGEDIDPADDEFAAIFPPSQKVSG